MYNLQWKKNINWFSQLYCSKTTKLPPEVTLTERSRETVEISQTQTSQFFTPTISLLRDTDVCTV